MFLRQITNAPGHTPKALRSPTAGKPMFLNYSTRNLLPLFPPSPPAVSILRNSVWQWLFCSWGYLKSNIWRTKVGDLGTKLWGQNRHQDSSVGTEVLSPAQMGRQQV